MKNMGLARLYLVEPKCFPSADATARASGADDILCRAAVCGSLLEAIAECGLVIGTSARPRTISWQVLSPRKCADLIARLSPETEVAVVFGREDSGLTNRELDLCGYWMTIPCNPKFSSLNLAGAVQIVAYELFSASSLELRCTEIESQQLASSARVESFYNHLYEVMVSVGFIHPDRSGSIMRRLRRLFNRAHLEDREIDILRGILSAAQEKNRTV